MPVSTSRWNWRTNPERRDADAERKSRKVVDPLKVNRVTRGVCLGGTGHGDEQSRNWMRLIDGDYEMQSGRVAGCNVKGRRVRSTCVTCPAFRPKPVDKQDPVEIPCNSEGMPYGLTIREHGQFEDADDPIEWIIGLNDPTGWRLKRSGTVEWDEFWAEYMRDYRHRNGQQRGDRSEERRRYREKHRGQVNEADRRRRANWTPEQIERNRELSRERMRRMKERRASLTPEE